MKWTTKAQLQRTCASTALGRQFYVHLQKRFGTLDASPANRIDAFVKLLEWLRESGKSPVGLRFLEVGTGQKATVPFFLALCGAESVTTVDLYPRLNDELMAGVAAYSLEHEDELRRTFGAFVPESVLDERFSLLRKVHRHTSMLADMGVRYVAPGDAASMSLDDDTIDIHVSITVLEHIPETVLIDILSEARRLLAPDGLAIHFIDLSDHFAHHDSSITRANFLQFSETEWTKLGGNELSYCNRLRAPVYDTIFEAAGLKALRSTATVDDASLRALDSGEIKPDASFAGYSNEVLATMTLDVALAAI